LAVVLKHRKAAFTRVTSAVPLVHERDGGWAFAGLRHRGSAGDLTLAIPVRVRLDDEGEPLATRRARR
jgi:hypothetical protein